MLRSQRLFTHDEYLSPRSAFKSMGYGNADFKKPIIGIANSFTELVPGHTNLRELADWVKRGIYAGGGTAVEFGCIATCDCLSNGHKGQYYSLPSRDIIADEIEAAFADFDIPLRIILGQYERYAAFQASVFAIAASGTVSLELVACGTPHIITYKFGYITNTLLERFAGTRYANLINILANRHVIPEFVLRHCCEELITPAVLDFMQHPERGKAQVEEAQKYLLKLYPANNAMPSEKAAAVVLSMMK